MKDFGSARGFRVVGLVASLAVVWAMFRIHDFPWTGLVWASLALSASLWVRKTSNGSMVIADVDAEPVRVAATVRKAVP